uniref:Uncharacterized protein n=1 Tax=Tanacetum cinerariifolium TaxID=118510 RepID=A0A6L2L3R4_TANCI|nr:hypothetical protein [Tanacetum cinerariifolium]
MWRQSLVFKPATSERVGNITFHKIRQGWKIEKKTTDTDTCLASGDETLNDATTRVDAAMKVVSPSVVEKTIVMDCPVVNTLGVGPNPPPPTEQANAPAGNAPAYGFFLGKKVAYPVANYVRNTWDAMLENGPSSSGNKKKGVEPTIEVSNSNPFDVLNSVYNDVEFGTNGETTNLVNNETTSTGSSFMNIDNDGEFVSNTPIGEKIYKIKRQICKGKLRLLDNDGNPLVPTGIVESESEVEVVLDETANIRILTSGKDRSDKGYDTNILLE